MCGRSTDLAALARIGHDVVGVEYVREAVEALGRQQGVVVRQGLSVGSGGGGGGGFEIFFCDVSRARGSCVVLCGDVLSSSVGMCGGRFDAIWDRGGLSTIPFARWSEYLRLCHELLLPGGKMLLESLETEHPQGFVAPADLEAACTGLFSVAQLSEKDVTSSYPDAPVPWVKERVHMLSRIEGNAAPPSGAGAT